MNVPPRLRAVAGPILLAIAADFALRLLLTAPRGPLGLTQAIVATAFQAAVSFAVGWWLGTRTWPRRGRALTSRVLRRMLRAKNRPFIVVTDRPDRLPTRWRRVLEVVAFAAGTSVILTAVLVTLGAGALLAGALGAFILLAAVWGSFALVPYWAAMRMGLRVVDPVRWTVMPVSRRYADRLRLSNGAILLIALGVFVNLAVRAGHSQDQALVQGVGAVASIVASVLVIAATAVAYYAMGEHALVRELEAETIRLGVRDGRGMSDGDFLPRLPPQKGDGRAAGENDSLGGG